MLKDASILRTLFSTKYFVDASSALLPTIYPLPNQGHEPECQINRYIEKFGPGTYHVAFAVSDIKAALANFPAHVRPEATPIIEGEGIRQVFLNRTLGSGVRVELIERKGGDFSDETVLRLFRSFEEKGLF